MGFDSYQATVYLKKDLKTYFKKIEKRLDFIERLVGISIGQENVRIVETQIKEKHDQIIKKQKENKDKRVKKEQETKQKINEMHLKSSDPIGRHLATKGYDLSMIGPNFIILQMIGFVLIAICCVPFLSSGLGPYLLVLMFIEPVVFCLIGSYLNTLISDKNDPAPSSLSPTKNPCGEQNCDCEHFKGGTLICEYCDHPWLCHKPK